MKKYVFALLTCAMLTGASLRAADTYTIDPVHSTAIYRILHLKTSYSYGRFNDIGGTIVLDEQNPAASSVQIEIKVDSIDTNMPAREKHLKSQDFFSAKEFPTITFTSKSVAKNGDAYDVTGDLTIHGVTKTVTTTVNQTGKNKHPMSGNPIIGFETTFKIKRSDYGMGFMLEGASDDVLLLFAVEAEKK